MVNPVSANRASSRLPLNQAAMAPASGADGGFGAALDAAQQPDKAAPSPAGSKAGLPSVSAGGAPVAVQVPAVAVENGPPAPLSAGRGFVAATVWSVAGTMPVAKPVANRAPAKPARDGETKGPRASTPQGQPSALAGPMTLTVFPVPEQLPNSATLVPGELAGSKGVAAKAGPEVAKAGVDPGRSTPTPAVPDGGAGVVVAGGDTRLGSSGGQPGAPVQPTMPPVLSPPAIPAAGPPIVTPASPLASSGQAKPLAALPTRATEQVGQGGGAVSTSLVAGSDQRLGSGLSPALLQGMSAAVNLGGMTVARGPGRVAPGLPISVAGVSPVDLPPDGVAGIDVLAAGPVPVAADLIGISPIVQLANTDVADLAVNATARKPGRDLASVPQQPGSGTPEANLHAIPPQGSDMQAVPVNGQASPISAAAGHAPAASVAAQVAPGIVAMAQSPVGTGRLSISITPEALGQVHITVERATDGTTSIHVAAEQMATLDLLRQDQGSLNAALDQAGIGNAGHNLSFSWDGGSAGGALNWGSPGQQSGGNHTANNPSPYAEDVPSTSSTKAAARGGIDVTA